MAAAVTEVDDQPDGHPHEQTNPGIAGQAEHLRAAHDDREWADHPYPGCAEGSAKVRVLFAHHHHRRADNHEGQQSPDAHQFPHDTQGQQATGQGHASPRQRRAFVGRPEARVDVAKSLGEQPVMSHGIEHAGLAQHHHQDDRGRAEQRADFDDGRKPHARGRRIDGEGQRIRHIQLPEGRQTRQNQNHGNVKHGANPERTQDANRHVALRVSRFLRGRGDRVKPNVGEEDDPRPSQHSRQAELAEGALVRRQERVPVGAIYIKGADHNEHHDDAKLHHHDQAVEVRGFTDADDEQRRDQDHDESCRQIEVGANHGAVRQHHRLPGTLAQFRGKRQVQGPLQERNQVARPADGYGGGADRIFQNQVPADDPGQKLSDGDIRIGVGTPRHGDR